MAKYTKYQEGSEVQPIDYSSFGFIRPDVMESLFTSQEQAPAYGDAMIDPYSSVEDEGVGEDNGESELSLLREQNEILKQTLDQYKSMQEGVDADLEIDKFIDFINNEDNIPVDPDMIESEYTNYKISQFEQAATTVLENTPESYARGFRTFNTPEEGRAALLNQLNLYKTGKTRVGLSPNSTLYDAMSKYAPAADRNNPKKYAEFIANRLGITPSTPIGNIDVEKWADAITIMEGNKYGNNPGNLRRSRQIGGYIPTAITPEDQQMGLNNRNYNEMLFNTEGYNQFRGLDSYEPVYVVDENGKQRVLIGNDQSDIFNGSVYEENLEYLKNGGIPDRYKNMGFSRVGQKKTSSRPGKKWMVLAKKGSKYKVVHGGAKGMSDYTKHKDEDRKDRFWKRHNAGAPGKSKDPFSPLYWHKKFKTW
jgi:hypothetical protein